MPNNPNAIANLKPFCTGYDARRHGNGRPKGRRSLSTIIRDIMENAVTWEDMPVRDQNGHCLKFDDSVPWEAVVYVAVGQAMNGDVRAMEWLRKSAYGNKLNVDRTPGAPSVTRAYRIVVEVADGQRY